MWLRTISLSDLYQRHRAWNGLSAALISDLTRLRCLWKVLPVPFFSSVNDNHIHRVMIEQQDHCWDDWQLHLPPRWVHFALDSEGNLLDCFALQHKQSWSGDKRRQGARRKTSPACLSSSEKPKMAGGGLRKKSAEINPVWDKDDQSSQPWSRCLWHLKPNYLMIKNVTHKTSAWV